MSAMSPPWNAGHNPHIQKFMARKAPKPIEPRKVVHKAETETICAYPKGDSLTQTVILKNMNMRMAVKDSALAIEPEKKEIYGRQKSDITSGHENLYERSYY